MYKPVSLTSKQELTLRALDQIGVATEQAIAQMTGLSQRDVILELCLLAADGLVDHDPGVDDALSRGVQLGFLHLGGQLEWWYYVTGAGRDWLLERRHVRRRRPRPVDRSLFAVQP